MKFRAAAIAATSVGVVLLAVGPTRVFLATEDDVATPQVEVDRVSDLALPDPKASSRWRAGLVDTAEALPGEDRVRLGRPERVEYAEAAARAEQPGVVSVVGEPDERTQGGVGAVVGSGDVAALLDLDSPLRDALAGDLVGADALALGVVAVGDLPDGALVVDSGSNPARKDRLTDAAPRVAALADLWSSVRPDLRVLFTPGEPETTATPDVTGQVARTGSKAWWRSVRRAVERDLLPTLDRTRAPLADVLLGPAPDNATRVAISMLSAGVHGCVNDPMIADLDDAELQKILLDFTKRFLEVCVPAQ